MDVRKDILCQGSTIRQCNPVVSELTVVMRDSTRRAMGFGRIWSRRLAVSQAQLEPVEAKSVLSSKPERHSSDPQGVVSKVNVSQPNADLLPTTEMVHLRLAASIDPHTRVPGQTEVKDRR